MPITAVEKTVWCRTSFIGFHRWPGAPSNVAHLRFSHRHKFNVEVHVLVTHDDRDIEFQSLKRNVDGIIASNVMFKQCIRVGDSPNYFEAPSYSCEMLAEELAKEITALSTVKVHKVTIDEDGENGATIYYAET